MYRTRKSPVLTHWKSLLTTFFFLWFPAYSSAAVITTQEEMETSAFDSFIEFLVHPIVIPILLTIGFLGLIIELFTPRFGLAGIVGIIAFILYFYGHIVSGLAGIGTFLLFAGGIVLILLELVLPGGILGLLGFGAVLASFFMSAANFVHIGISLLIAFTISILASMVMIKVFDKKMKFFKKFILTDSTDTESGYVSNQNRTDLIGKKGVAFTDLRPSGTVIVGDERIDVVTEGMFIMKDTFVKVIKVEGSRIVVREWKEMDSE